MSARNLLKSNVGRLTSIGLAIIATGAFAYTVWSFFGESRSASHSGDRTFVCSETGKTFPHQLTIGEMTPIESPFTGKSTAYPADETCYWTADGKVKAQPTYVLMNRTLKKRGPTFCPDCGRLVIRDNPMAISGHAPPPTQDEYARSNAGKAKTAKADSFDQ